MLGLDGGGQEVSISRAKGVGGNVWMKELGQVGWSQDIEGFVGHEKEFEMDSPGDGELMELIEDRGDLVTG